VSDANYCPLCGSHEFEWGEGDSHLPVFVVMVNATPVSVHLSVESAKDWVNKFEPEGERRIEEVKIVESPSIIGHRIGCEP